MTQGLEIAPLKALSFHTKPCVTSYTPGRRPVVDVVEAHRIYLAAGGCGSAAKSSDEIGRMAALLVEKESWTYDLDRETFKAHYVA